MPRTSRSTPAELADQWPDVPSTDPTVEAARRFAVNLREAIGDRSIRSVAADAGLNHGTLLKALNGTAWVDAKTIASLEASLACGLWVSPTFHA